MGIATFATKYYSELKDDNELNSAVSFLKNKLAHPDKNSDFDKENFALKYLVRIFPTKFIKKTFDKKLKQGYEVLLLYASSNEESSSNEIIGFTAFHKHTKKYSNLFKGQVDSEIHIFRMELNPFYQMKGLAKKMSNSIITHAIEKNIPYVRFGRNNYMMDLLLKSIHRNSDITGARVLSPRYFRGPNFVQVYGASSSQRTETKE